MRGRVLVCGEEDGEELAARLEEEPGAGVWGLVVEGGRFAGRSAGASWARLLGRARIVRRTPPPPLPLPERALPGLGELLPGAPRASRVVEDPVLFHLRLVPLAEVLQSAVGWSAPGTLVVFGQGRFGWVEVAHGRIRGVGELGHHAEPAPGPEEEVYRVLKRMAAWEDASVAFVPAERPVEGPARLEGVPVGHALFAVAKAADEVGPGDGGDGADTGLRAYQVAEALLEWGLPSLAGAFLERAERASTWGAEEDLLLGHLSAERNPQGAAARLRHGALRAVSADAQDPARLGVYVSATLGALILEVRAGYTVPSAALAVIRGWLDDAGTGWVADARHAAIWFEIALRAGAAESAKAAQRTLEELAGVERSRWAPLLEISLSGDGGVIRESRNEPRGARRRGGRAGSRRGGASRGPVGPGVSVGLLTAVLLTGVAIGGWLAADEGTPAPVAVAAAGEAPRREPAPPPVEAPGSLPDSPPAKRQGSAGARPAAGTYTPVAGGWVEGGETRPWADTLMAAPELPGRREPEADGAPAAPAATPRAPRRAEISDPGAAERIEDPAALGTPLLAVQREGGRVVLYEPRAGGSAGVPREIEGGWGWLGDCRRIRIDLAMGPSREAGTVRAVGRGTGAARVGWVVPVRGCAGASRRLRRAGGGSLVDAGGVTWKVEPAAGGVRITGRSSSGAEVWSGEAPRSAGGVRILGAYRPLRGAGEEEVWIVATDDAGAPRAFLRVVGGRAPGGPRTDGWVSLGAKGWIEDAEA